MKKKKGVGYYIAVWENALSLSNGNYVSNFEILDLFCIFTFAPYTFFNITYYIYRNGNMGLKRTEKKKENKRIHLNHPSI